MAKRRRGADAGSLIAVVVKVLGMLLGVLFNLAGKGSSSPGSGRASVRPGATGAVSGGGGRQLTAGPDFTWPQRGEFDFNVVGESFHQEALRAVAEAIADVYSAFDVNLVPYESPHDPRAVAVVWQGRVLGHLSRPDARSYRRRLTSMKRGELIGQCRAQLIGGHELHAGGTAAFGVVLDIKPFD